MRTVEPYHIRTKVYDGPLDLLLTLIEKRKLLINDIALSEVTDDYLKHLEGQEEVSVGEIAQFVLVGSTLLLIKSKSLLPVLSLTNEEQGSIDDLELRLKLFDRYKKIAQNVAYQYGSVVLFGRQSVRRRKPEFSPDASMTIDNMVTSIGDVLRQLPKGKNTLSKTVVKKVVSLEDMMDRLTDRINSSMQVSFRQFSGTEGKLNVIVSFLAMLELVRQGVIRVEQHERFSDIHMHADVVTVPRYG